MSRIPVHRVWRLASAIVVSVVVMTALARPDGRTGATAAAGQPRPPQHPAASVRGPSQVWLPLALRSFAGTPPLGVQFYSIPAEALELADQAGARWVRDVAEWARIEPVNTTPANYNWAALDQSVTAVTQRGIGLVLTLRDAPSWAAPTPQGPVTNLADLVQFASAVVERYDSDGISDAPGSPYVRYFELYNEPDSTLGAWGGHGAEYAQMLRAVYPAIHAANPDALVVFGGLALDNWVEDDGPFDRGFLDTVLAACRDRACFDVMNFHYFPFYRLGWEQYGPDIIGKATYVRQRLAAYGFHDVPLICTETTWAIAWGGDEAQSRYVAKVYARAMAADLDITIWYAMMDGSDQSRPGLLSPDMQPRPGYVAYQTAAAMLAGAHFDRVLTTEETGSSQLVGYTFTALGRRLDVVWTEDSTPGYIHDDPWLTYSAPVTRLRIVDKFGNVTWRRDADDGTVDGQTRLAVGGSPLFLEYFP